MDKCSGHNNFYLRNDVFISSDFDSGNLANVVEDEISQFEYSLWTAPDNMGTPYEARQSPYFHFSISGLPPSSGGTLRFKICNPGMTSHALYKQDLRPVVKSSASNHKWTRIKRSIRITCTESEKYVYFEHQFIENETKIYFAFTYPYSFECLQQKLQIIDELHSQEHLKENFTAPSRSKAPILEGIFYKRELLILSPEGRRVDLITITSSTSISTNVKESLLPDIFPEGSDCPHFPDKGILFISARVHPGEIPSSHTFQGILDFLLDATDARAIELRRRYVFKMIPCINPDGVFRGIRLCSLLVSHLFVCTYLTNSL